MVIAVNNSYCQNKVPLADLESQRGLQAAQYQPTPPTDTSGPIVATANAG